MEGGSGRERERLDRARAARKMASVVALAVTVGGCVVNPYIRTPAVAPVGKLDRHSCSNLVVTTGDHRELATNKAKALLYAECVRDAMAKKAGRYAWMNNGGAVVLLNMAGIAGYSGIRGGHNAQVAALTTGGATFYGAQQYLYRKPREVIYWSGANALGCAIGVTHRRSLVSEEANELASLIDDAAKTSLDSAERDARIALQVALSTAHCSATMRAEDDLLSKQAGDILSPATGLALKSRQVALMRRYQTLSMADRYAFVDLVATTDAIRDTINRQLAAEQPDPSELAKLVASLKLPSLEGKVVKSGATQDNGTSSGLLGIPPTPSTSGNKSRAERGQCLRTETQHGDFKHRTTALIDQYNDLNRKLDELEARIGVIEARAGASPHSNDALKYCTLASTNSLLPFGLAFAGEGPQIAKPGGTLKVAITGGVPPYGVRLVSDDAYDLSATAQAAEGGAFEIAIAVPEKAPDGKIVSWLIRDAVGASEVLQVKVAK